MPYDLKKTGPKNALRVNIHEPWEVKYWCRKFGCTSAQLVDAVCAVGTSAATVRRDLAPQPAGQRN